MKQGIFFIISLFVFISCSDFKFENCILHSRSHTLIIDLSDNSEHESWLPVDPDSPNNASFYFSLCPKGKSECPGNSYFCLNINGTILDLGSTYIGTSDDTIEDIIVYNMSLKGQRGSGFVYIQCDPSGSFPPMLTSLTNRSKDGVVYFDYSITWRSNTNCPVKHFSVRNNCILYTDSRSYDLRPMRGSHRVSVAGKDYIINLCEVMSSDCPSHVCEVVDGGRPRVLSTFFELSYMEPKGLSFTYRMEGIKIVIYLSCSPEKEDYTLDHFPKIGDDLFFSIKTPLVCEPPPINCLLQDRNKKIAYDLYGLNKMIDNYEWNLSGGKRLLFNVCGTLNYNPWVSCADGFRNFGCIVNNENKTEAVATLANVSVLGPGQISIVYSSTNLKKNNLSVYFTLKCSKHVSGNPILNKTGVDSFTLNWNTNAACPIKYATGENCVVEHLYNKSKVNLMPLHKINTDYFILNGKESFRINVCGVLNQSCSRNSKAAVCFKNSNGTEIAIGETGALEPKFIDGQFIFDLEGEPCHKNATKSRVKIIMACEFPNSTSSIYVPELFPSTKENECMYYFHWKTPLVCGSAVSSNCTYSNGYLNFNLSSLKNLRENYIIDYDDDAKIELNICHSLIPGHRIHCHEWSVACLKNYSINSIISAAYDKYENNDNLGMASEPDEFKIIDNNNIRLYYKNGGICGTSKTESVYSTLIDFICNKTASQSSPKLISVEDCEFKFSWITSAACPTYESKSSPCSLNISNKTFDFSHLMGKNFLVKVPSENYEINIGICSPVDIIGCSRKSGSCLVKGGKAENLGNYNSKLHYVNESLSLIYEGDNCKSTVIEFSCGNSESSGPVLIRRNNCLTVISWSTSLACLDDYGLNEIKCCQGIEDLCEKLNKTYEVEINKQKKAFINICKPLIPKWGILCPSGSVSCLANNESKYSFSSEKGLGSYMLPPQFLNDKTALLKYFDGSVCHKDSETRYSTSIKFFCDGNVHIGRPKLLNISEDCQYEFEWPTSLMCHKNCTLPFGNKNRGVLLQFQDWDKIIFSKNGLVKSRYIMNLCQVSTRCGSHICKMDKTSKWLRFAGVNSSEVSDTKTKIFYKYLSSNTSKESCGAQVDLVCDNEDRGPGRPYLEEETDCFIHVIWKSNLACFPEKDSEGSSNIVAWSIFSIAILALVVIVIVMLRFYGPINLGFCVNRTLGYRRDLEIAELQM